MSAAQSPALVSGNWAGYYKVVPGNQQFWAAEVSFTVPNVVCSNSRGPAPYYGAMWAGIGGIESQEPGAWLEQTGVNITCASKSAKPVFFGGGALVFIVSIATRRVALKVDARGVTLGGSPGRSRSGERLIPWADIKEIVIWRQPMSYGRSVPCVGVVRRKCAAPLAGRRGRRASRATASALTRGVSGDTLLASRAVNLWRLDGHRLSAAVAHFGPGVRVVDRQRGEVSEAVG